MADGTTRVVPHPRDRIGVVKKAHIHSGHFGVKRTAHLVFQAYWWSGITRDIAKIVTSCKVCREAKAQFNTPAATLNSLPLMKLLYRLHVDLMGPFIVSDGMRFVMIMLEAGTKTLILHALPAKEARYTAAAFEQCVLGRMGSCAEVVSDGGGEWLKEFAAMLAANFIDHRVTSAQHPQSNGAAERCVMFAKQCLRKHCVDTQSVTEWPKALPYIAMGYNCSKQKSSNCSPWALLYAREPVFPSAVAPRMTEIIDVEGNKEAAANSIIQRAQWLRNAIPTVANNLAIAQHRDTLRYAMTTSGTYLPKLVKFQPGDYVNISGEQR